MVSIVRMYLLLVSNSSLFSETPKYHRAQLSSYGAGTCNPFDQQTVICHRVNYVHVSHRWHICCYHGCWRSMFVYYVKTILAAQLGYLLFCEVMIVIKALWIQYYCSLFPWSTCRGGGVIVNLSSISDVMVLPFLTTYSATKVDLPVIA